MSVHEINSSTTINGNTWHTVGETTITGENSVTNTVTYENGTEVCKSHITNNIANGVDSWSSTTTMEPSGKEITSHGSFNV